MSQPPTLPESGSSASRRCRTPARLRAAAGPQAWPARLRGAVVGAGCGSGEDRGSAELAVVAIGLFALIGFTLMLAVTFIASQAATSAAQRGVQIVQTPGGSESEARQVAGRITASSGMITASTVDVAGTPDTVTVTVSTRTVLGKTVSRVATGPRLRFIPQGQHP